MTDKNIVKTGLNDRLKEIDELVDKLKPNDYINKLKKQYHEELKHYKYICTVEEFSILKLKGSMRYINKFDKKLRYGGLLIKIYKKDLKWYGIIKKNDNTKNYVSFDSNYIFYCQDIGEIHNLEFRESLKFFVTDVEDDKYDIV